MLFHFYAQSRTKTTHCISARLMHCLVLNYYQLPVEGGVILSVCLCMHACSLGNTAGIYIPNMQIQLQNFIIPADSLLNFLWVITMDLYKHEQKNNFEEHRLRAIFTPMHAKNKPFHVSNGKKRIQYLITHEDRTLETNYQVKQPLGSWLWSGCELGPNPMRLSASSKPLPLVVVSQKYYKALLLLAIRAYCQHWPNARPQHQEDLTRSQ